jgi:paraquat-inducible protein A
MARHMALGGRSFLLGAALAIASVCLALGLTLPILKLSRFYFFSTEHSLVSAVNALLRSGQVFLGLTVLVFAIFLPVLKLLYLLLLAALPQHEFTRLTKQLRALEWLGKWSMHDVLVLAIAIFFVKSQGLSDARSVPGMYFFFAAVALMMLAYLWLKSDLSNNHSVVVRKDGSPSALRNLVFSVVLILAIVCLGLGVFLPAVRFTTVYVWSQEHSIASMIWALYTREQLLLCFVVFLVSVLFPFLKLLYLLTLVMTPQMPRAMWSRSFAVMEWLGRYSMTDIMLLALMIFYINASGFAEAMILPGVYLFAASALLTMLAYGWAHSVGVAAVLPQPGSLAERLAQVSSGGSETNLRQS